MSADSRPDPNLYASINGTVYPLSAEECVFRTRRDGEKHVMTLQVLKAMDRCSRFRTLDDHVRAVMESDAALQGRDEAVRRVVGALKQRGLMVSARETLDRLASVRGPTPAPLVGVFVRTGGRPRALGRLLRALRENHDRYGTELPCYVLDDCSDRNLAGECLQLCERMRGEGIPAYWLDHEWQQDLLDILGRKAGTSPDVLDWLRPEGAGEGFTGGRVWNLALLAAAGNRFLLLDDDIVPVARRMDEENRLRFDSREWAVWFHASDSDARENGQSLEFDPLAGHAEYLGAGLAEAITRLSPEQGRLAGLDQRRLEALDPGAPVVATVSGTYGDAASGSNVWLYTLEGASRERFWSSREAYDVNRLTRWLTRARDGYSFQSQSNFTPVGLDGGMLLPPTLPWGRNEDFLFNVLLKRVHPGARTLEFPWALGHFPETERRWKVDPLKAPRTENLAAFAADALLSLEDSLAGGPAAHRIRYCADQLRGMAQAGVGGLRDRIDEYLLFLRSDVVSAVQRQLAENPGAPVYWAADARAVVEANGKALTASGMARLTDMPANGSDEDAVVSVQARLERFASLLEAWPALYEAAREHDALPR